MHGSARRTRAGPGRYSPTRDGRGPRQGPRSPVAASSASAGALPGGVSCRAGRPDRRSGPSFSTAAAVTRAGARDPRSLETVIHRLPAGHAAPETGRGPEHPGRRCRRYTPRLPAGRGGFRVRITRQRAPAVGMLGFAWGAVESKAYATRDSGENEQSGSQRTPADGSVTEGRPA